MNNLPVDSTKLNCFHFLAVSAAKLFDCDYRLMMLELWGFKYDKTKKPIIGERLDLCWKSRLDERKQLLNFHNVSFDIMDFSVDVFEEILTYIKDNQLIAVYIDSYHCSWLPFYMKMHRSHAFLITAMHNETLVIFDQYANGLTIDKQFVKSNADKMVIFYKHLYENKKSITDYLMNSIDQWEKVYFPHYQEFIFDMKNILNIKSEVIDDPIASKLLMYLKNLSEDRINFVETINLVESTYKLDLLNIKNMLGTISQEYNKIRLHLVKCAYLSKSHSFDNVSNSLDVILKNECNVVEEIRAIVLREKGYARKRNKDIM